MTLVGLSFVANGYTQSELNKAWAAEGGPVPDKDNMPAHLDSGPSGSAPSAPSGTSGDPLTEPVGSSTSSAPEAPEAPSSERPPGA